MKELERKISIIIPVYNAEKTLNRCIDSIVDQDYSNLEIIIIDNESTDNSLNIIKKYCKTYDFIKVYKSKSKMVGGVKNFGVKKANGEYFIFVDSDDYLQKNLLKCINKVLINNDYSLIRYNAYYNYKSNEYMFISNVKEGLYKGSDYLDLAINEFLINDKIFGPSWLYAYNRMFFINNNFKFRNRFQEDYGLTASIILKSKKIYVLEDVLYNYVFNNKGMTNNKNNYLNKAIDVIYHSNQYLKNIKNVTNKKIFIKYINETLRRKYIKLSNMQREIFLDYIERSEYIGKYINISDITNL